MHREQRREFAAVAAGEREPLSGLAVWARSDEAESRTGQRTPAVYQTVGFGFRSKSFWCQYG